MTAIATENYSFSTTGTASSTSSKASTAKEDSVMGKDDFLTLLVAQLKNQDPLNPDDPTEFTAQLAQFSSLEQLTNLNKSMEGLTTAQANSEKLSALSLIGKNVSYNGGTLDFNGEPTEVGYQLDSAATSVTLSIQDANGKTVYTKQAADTELKAGNHFITWNGTDQCGKPVASGKYKIILQASAAGEGASVAVSPLIRSEANGVDLSSGKITTTAGDVLFKDIIGVTELKNTPANSTQTAQNITNQLISQIQPAATINKPR
jgi:flagellar basal-body rod modification protein FlgD